MWQLRMHCNLRPPDATPLLFHFDMMPMPSLKSLNLPAVVYSVITVDTLHYAVT